MPSSLCDAILKAGGFLVVVHFQAHAVVNLVVLQGDVVFEHCVPFLNSNLFRARTHLRCNQLFQIANGVVLIDLHAHFFPQTVVANDFDHGEGEARNAGEEREERLGVKSSRKKLGEIPSPAWPSIGTQVSN